MLQRLNQSWRSKIYNSEKTVAYPFSTEQIMDLKNNRALSFAPNFDELGCRRCLNAKIMSMELNADQAFRFQMTHFGEDIFYTISNGVKDIKTYEVPAMIESDLGSRMSFGPTFAGHSPFSTLMLRPEEGSSLEKLSKITIFFKIEFYDSEFPDQHSQC